jgi:hypothetical protein
MYINFATICLSALSRYIDIFILFKISLFTIFYIFNWSVCVIFNICM